MEIVLGLVALVGLFFVGLSTYRRYVPVARVGCTDGPPSGIVMLDVRDFQDAHEAPVEGATNIPMAYLERSIAEVPNAPLRLIVSNSLERNLAIRFLRKKGFCIEGYQIRKK